MEQSNSRSSKTIFQELEFECAIEEFVIKNKYEVAAYVEKMIALCQLSFEIKDHTEARANIIKNLKIAFRYQQLRHGAQQEICHLFDGQYYPERPKMCHRMELLYSDHIFEPLSDEIISRCNKGSKKKRGVKNE